MSIQPTPWLLKSYSASVEAWSASMAQSASEMSASIAQSAESLSNRIDNINVSIPQSANWVSTYDTVKNGSANWNDTYTEFAKISGYDYSTINMAASAVSANSADWFNKDVDIPQSANWESTYGSVSTNSAKWMSTYDDMSTNSSKYDDTYGTVKQYSASWAAGGANIPESANWNETYTIVQNGSAHWNDSYGTIGSESGKWGDTYTTVDTSASNWGSVYDTVYSNSGAWGHGGITEIEVDNTTLSGDGINEAIGIKGPMLGLSAGPNINITEQDGNIVISGAEPKAGGLDTVAVFTEQLSGDGTSNQPIGINETFLPQIVSRYRKSTDTDVGYIGKATYVFHENYTEGKYNYIEVEDKADTQQRFKMYTLGQPWREMLSAGNGLSASAVSGAGSSTNGHWQVGIQLPENATENDDYVYTTSGWKKCEVTGDYLPLSGGTVSGSITLSGNGLYVNSLGNENYPNGGGTVFINDGATWLKDYTLDEFTDWRHDNVNMAAFGVRLSLGNTDAFKDYSWSATVEYPKSGMPIGFLQIGGNGDWSPKTSNKWKVWSQRFVYPMIIHKAGTTPPPDDDDYNWENDNTLHFILEPES